MSQYRIVCNGLGEYFIQHKRMDYSAWEINSIYWFNLEDKPYKSLEKAQKGLKEMIEAENIQDTLLKLKQTLTVMPSGLLNESGEL